MLRTLVTTAVLATALTTAMVPAAASAREHAGYGWQEDRSDWRDGRGDYGRSDDWRDREWQQRDHARRADHERRVDWQRRAYPQRAYGYNGGYANGYYVQPQSQYYQREGYIAPAYSGDRGYRCRADGTTGAVLGAIAGGLIGNSVAGRGNRTAGAVIGGVGGLFAGRAIERSGSRC